MTERLRNVRNTVPPNFPVSPVQYSRVFMDQFINILRLYLNTNANILNAPKVYGSFYSTSGQTNPVADAVHPVLFDATLTSFNIVTGTTTSRIYVAETGIYNIQYSGQFILSTGTNGPIYIWLRTNGVNVDNSGMKVVITGPNAEQVPSWNYILQLNANDYIEIVWSSPDIHSLLEYVPAAGSVPACPSFILCIQWVSNPPVQV
jgi:hypothetical protein